MLHGLASNGTRWREFAELASEQRDWQILCPDLRGHGLSMCRGRIDSRQWIDDLLALLDQVGCNRAVLGGHCLGANLALRFALHHPDRVRGLVLVEPMLPAALHGPLRYLRPVRWLLPALAHRFGVNSVPTVKFFRRGEGVHTIHGADPDSSFREVLNRFIAQDADRAHAQGVAAWQAGELQQARRLLAGAAMTSICATLRIQLLPCR
jgi:pimeloyl-ACP methyl ester carboxylesterase